MYLFIIFIWISHFMFFLANDLLVTAYFIFILDYRNVRQKSKFNRFFHSSSKWVVKQQRQLTTSTMHLAQELLTNVQRSGGSTSFVKEMGALKMRNVVTGHWKLTTTNRRQSLKLILLELYEELRNSTSTIPQSFGIWSKLERWKAR